MCDYSNYVEKEGIRKGIEQGRQKGRQEGENMLATLLEMLFADGRSEDARTAVRDKIKRNKFYKEYGIV